jgi:hypothetical protein
LPQPSSGWEGKGRAIAKTLKLLGYWKAVGSDVRNRSRQPDSMVAEEYAGCGTYLRLSFSRPSGGFFAVAAIPAARSFAMRPMSLTGTGLVSGNWTVPFRSS